LRKKYNFCKNSLNLQKKNGESYFDLSPHLVQAYLSGESVFYNYIAEKKVGVIFIKVVILL